MSLFAHMASIVAPSRISAGTPAPQDPFWYRDPHTGFMVGGHGIGGDLALTLSYVYSAVSIIADDFGSMTCQTFEDLGGERRRKVGYTDPGIGQLAEHLRWQPNAWQTAKAFWSTLAWQYLLRRAAYAEIVYRPGRAGFTVIDQIIPRHPDRVTEEPLLGPDGRATGRVRFRLTEPDLKRRYVSQDEMFVVRNTSLDGLNALSRIEYGGKSLRAGLALQDFTENYFTHGTSASTMAVYKGAQMEDEDEEALHRSITRYLSGVENAGGLLLIPEDIDIKAIGVSAKDAELLGLKNYSGRDVARMFKLPPSWLGIDGAAAYASQVQDATNYVNRVQIPITTEFEQAVRRDLIVAPRFFVKFNMDYQFRADLLGRMQAYAIGIRSRVLRPSECRVREDLNPDPQLDRLSESDHQPSPAGGRAATNPRAEAIARAAAQRVVRREAAAVLKAAQKHAKAPAAFLAWSHEFYTEHAAFVANAMGMTEDEAAQYCAEQRAQLEARGILVLGDWEREIPDQLARLALAVEDAA